MGKKELLFNFATGGYPVWAGEISSQDEKGFELLRAALEKESRGVSSEMWRFAHLGVTIEFSREWPERELSFFNRQYPERATLKLSDGKEIRLVFPAIQFSPKNLLSAMLAPEEALRKVWQNRGKMIIVSTSPQLEDPQDCFYTSLEFQPEEGGYFESHTMFPFRPETGAMLRDPQVVKVFLIFS